MKRNELREQLNDSVKEDLERIKDLSDEKERFLATKGMTEKVKARAELDKAESEKHSNRARLWTAITGVVLTLGTIVVELFKASNKDKTNQKILDNQINLMEQYERSCYDNK